MEHSRSPVASRNRILSYSCLYTGPHDGCKIHATLFMTSWGCRRKAEAKGNLSGCRLCLFILRSPSSCPPSPQAKGCSKRLVGLGELNEYVGLLDLSLCI